MANSEIQKSSSSRLANIGAGPKLIGLGVALFILNRIIVALPLGLIDGPINALLWLGILISIAAGIGLTIRKSKRP